MLHSFLKPQQIGITSHRWLKAIEVRLNKRCVHIVGHASISDALLARKDSQNKIRTTAASTVLKGTNHTF